MKVVILAGGIGSRITEESHLKPKPMIEIGGKPILWHIMKIYETQGFNEFIVCLGYKGYVIKEYFLNYFKYNSNLSIDISNNEVKVHSTEGDDFKVTLIDTGEHTLTAGRIKQIEPYIEGDDFFLTYGDGVANVDIKSELEFHKKHGKICTMTVVQPAGKFGSLEFDEENKVTNFKEKPVGDKNWINAGFFIVNRNVFSLLENDSDNMMWEQKPLEKLTSDNQLMVFKHNGFWKCMDAMRDKMVLEELWDSNNAEWKIW